MCIRMHLWVNMYYATSPGALGRHSETVRWRHGGTEAWEAWEAWDGCVVWGGSTPFEIQPCSLSEEVVSLGDRMRPRESSRGCCPSGGFQKLVGYQTEGVRGHVCAPMQVTDALQPSTPAAAEAWLDKKRL